MNVFVSLGLIILPMLIVSLMTIIPGIFALFYHYASGRYTVKKINNLSIFFILGVETLSAVIFILLNYFSCALSFIDTKSMNSTIYWIIIGILVSLSFSFFFFYFRRGQGTKTFIARKTAKNYDQKARKVKTPSDAFFLGFISGLPELFFTLPLYLIVLIETSKFFTTTTANAFILLLFILSTTIPLFFTYAYFKNGNNLATFEKLRIKNKKFFRYFISSLYLILSILILIFRIII